MSKASRCFTGSKKSVGTPTLSKNNYFQLIRTIRQKMPPVTATTDGKAADETSAERTR